MLNTKNIQRQRLRSYRHQAVLPDDSILFSSTDQLARQQQQRPLAAIEQHQLIYRRPI
jgi:hypothetical protein